MYLHPSQPISIYLNEPNCPVLMIHFATKKSYNLKSLEFMEVKSFENLEVWQMGRDLVTKVYMLTASLPQSETFGLTAQTKRAALSVPANIAEGFGRYHYMDKAKFYLNARGSLYELKSHLLIAQDLGYLEKSQAVSDILTLMNNLSIKLNNLIATTRKLKNKESQ
jgi:four helix bundle protein